MLFTNIILVALGSFASAAPPSSGDTSSMIAAAAASIVHPGSSSPSNIPKGACGDMRVKCNGQALLCCDKLTDKNDASDADMTSGIYSHCHGIHTPFLADLDAVKKSCTRTPACCDLFQESGPPSPASMCTSLEAVLSKSSNASDSM